MGRKTLIVGATGLEVVVGSTGLVVVVGACLLEGRPEINIKMGALVVLSGCSEVGNLGLMLSARLTKLPG